METGVGTDIVGVLKTVKGACERALEDFANERVKRDPANYADAAECLREIDQFIGGGKLQVMIYTLDGIAKK